jgi:hypothetical protein
MGGYVPHKLGGGDGALRPHPLPGSFDIGAFYGTLSRQVLVLTSIVVIFAGLVLVAWVLTAYRDGTALSSPSSLLPIVGGVILILAFGWYFAWDSAKHRPVALDVTTDGLTVSTAARRAYTVHWADAPRLITLAEAWYPSSRPELRRATGRVFSPSFPFSPVVVPIEAIDLARRFASMNALQAVTAELVTRGRYARHDWVTRFESDPSQQ